MATVKALLDRLAMDLNDDETGHRHVAWPRKQLRRFVADAVNLLFDRRPEAFTEEAVLTVHSCAGYSPVDPCDSLSYDGVEGASDAAGNVLHALRPCSDDPAMRWPGRECAPARPYRMRDYSIAKDGKGIRVYPPVPPGECAHVAVRCPVRPREFPDGLEIDDALVPAVVQWCLYLAKMMDSENDAAVIASAREHEDAFWAIVQGGPLRKPAAERRKDA
jgi:hypothetical protein